MSKQEFETQGRQKAYK